MKFISSCLGTMLLIILFFSSCQTVQESTTYNWDNTFDRTWVGPEFWANRLQDWEIQKGRLHCKIADPMRTVHSLTHSLDTLNGDFSLTVETGILNYNDSIATDAATGFLIGAGSDLDYRAASLIHNSYGKSAGLFAGLDFEGKLFLRDFEQEWAFYDRKKLEIPNQFDQLKLTLSVKHNTATNLYSLLISVLNESGELIGELEVQSLPKEKFVGNIALVSHSGSGKNTGRFWFNNFQITGSKIKTNPNRNCGPIICAQHTLNNGILKLTAQLMPLGSEDNQKVSLKIKQGNSWVNKAESQLITPGFTVPFKILDWDEQMDTPYRLTYQLTNKDGIPETYDYEGVIRKNPLGKEEIILAGFTGNHNNVRPNREKWGGIDVGKFPWDWGLWFPHNDIVNHVKKHQPDVLFFSGDQVYEGASPTFADRKNAHLDYLYKWYLWCWAFGELTAEIPTVTIPDDHDVYHGNIWGAGGKATPEGLYGAAAQDKGGYKMSPDFVNMVQRTQTSHLPDPYDPNPVLQDISVYYSNWNYGGISFAILEDRKFKSAPSPLLPEGNIINGWALNEQFNAKTQSDHPEAKLLGDRQLAFLENWVADWSNGTQMKAVLSQTIFSNVATLPANELNDAVVPRLPILQKFQYPPIDRPVSDMDSNGWPKTGRDKALGLIRKAFAVHIAGDQHLGSTIQYGIEDWKDAGYALCVPSIANFFPRRWMPRNCGQNRHFAAPCYVGDFEDGFGNKMTILAASNPMFPQKRPIELHGKSPGYGIAKFNKSKREITFSNWPRFANPEQDKPYEGWPITFSQDENFGKKIFGWLPELTIEGIENAVVQVFSEDESLLYSIRIKGNSIKPKVFEEGVYSIKVGEPDENNWKKFENLVPKDSTQNSSLKIQF